MSENSQQFEHLVQINLDDLLQNLGWENWPMGKWAARTLFGWPARQFAHQMIQFDRDVDSFGLQESARHFLPGFSRGLQVSGAEYVPARGPVLILSNHPGMADTLALFSAISRPDLRVVGLERPFLKQLPALSRCMIYLPELEEGRLQVIRSMLGGLQAGGAMLTFPAGHIEPDPAVLPGAVESLDCWSESIALFIRKVPEVTVVGAVVSHVLAPEATFHPLTRLRRAEKDRQRLGASIQLVMRTLFPNLWPLTACITFTPPLAASGLVALRHAPAITRAVTDHIRPYVAAAQRPMRVY
jgi:hypothetical protein